MLLAVVVKRLAVVHGGSSECETVGPTMDEEREREKEREKAL